MPDETRVLSSPPETGWLVTNHLNLLYMLAAGLVLPPAGFGDKYYADPLAAFPGWIPLFTARKPPVTAVEQAVSEGRPLRPVAVQVDLTGLSDGLGRVVAVGSSSPFVATVHGILVPAPLPTCLIRSVKFRSDEDREYCQEIAEETSNASLADFNRRRNEGVFRGSRKPPWPPAEGPADRRARSLETVQAVGGAMAALFHLGNLGPLAARAVQAAFGGDSPEAESIESRILGALPEWVSTGTVAVPDGPRRTSRSLFWGAVDRLIKHRREPGYAREEDVLIEYLEESAAALDGDQRAGAQALARTLDDLGSMRGGTISALVKGHGNTLARALILFFLRQKTIDLVKPNFDTDLLTEEDRLAAAILFGVRDGWLGLPMELRGTADFGRGVTHRMAALAHRIDATGFSLGKAPERVRPLRELFSASEPWSVREKRAALLLARKAKWDCIHSRVTLKKGEYRMRIEGGAMRVEFDGEAPVETWVDPADLLERLAGEGIAPALEEKVRKELGG